jgi:hypothetical protein
MSAAEQDKSMNPVQLLRNVAFARATGLGYADLWGAEWWYWRKITFHDNDLWSTATQIFKNPAE